MYEVLSSLSLVLIIVCALIVIGLCIMAKKCIANGLPSNHASYAVSIGVLFTFIGVTFSLLGFKIPDGSSPDTMVQSVASFLDGMQLAFLTSIFGMMGSFIIKRMERFSRNKESESDALARKCLATLCSQNESVVYSLKNIDNTLNESSDAAVARELQNLAVAIAHNTNAATEQTALFKAAFNQLTLTSERQMTEMRRSVSEQQTALNHLADIFRDSVAEQSRQLSESTARLDNVSDKFTQMADDTRAMLVATRTFHAAQAQQAAENLANMRDNTAKMDALTVAFNGFLTDMSEKFSDNFIRSLRTCIENLNENLKEQFGENFRRLDEAVGKLNVWQQENKEEIEKLTDAYTTVHVAYQEFITKQRETNDTVTGLNKMLAEFRDLVEQTNENVEHGGALQQQVERTLLLSEENAKRGAELALSYQQVLTDYDQDMRTLATDIAGNFTKLRDGIREDIIATIETMKSRNEEVITSAGINLELVYDELGKSVDKCAENVRNYAEAIAKQNMVVTNTTHGFAEAMENSTKKVGQVAEGFESNWADSLDSVKIKMQEDILTINRALADAQNDFNRNLTKAMAGVAGKIAAQYESVADAIDRINSAVVRR